MKFLIPTSWVLHFNSEFPNHKPKQFTGMHRACRYFFILFLATSIHTTVFSQDNCCGSGKGDRVKSMTLLYNGGTCALSDNGQGTNGDKWSCTGDANADPQVYIVVNDQNGTGTGGTLYFSGVVNLNQSFTAAAATEVKNPVYVHIFNQQGGSQLQLVSFQTHCSVPLAAGDRFGAVTVKDITFKNGYFCQPADPCATFQPSIRGNAYTCTDNIQPSTIRVTGGTSWLWSTGATTSAITVTPLVKKDYTVTVTNADLCQVVLSHTIDIIACEGKQCFSGNNVGATVSWKIILDDDPSLSRVNIRVTYSKNFVDNTYGTTAISWPNGHTFNNLVGSDKLQLALFDALNTKKMELIVDYISASASAPSGYACLGVTGGEGSMLLGNASDVLYTSTSLDRNLNDFGYVLTTNSPATDQMYTPNPIYPLWIYDVWYEVDVRLSVFGNGGFGKANFLNIHASPSKTGNNTEPVSEINCCLLTAIIQGDSLLCQGKETMLTASYTEKTTIGLSAEIDAYIAQGSPSSNYGNCNRLYSGSTSSNSNRSLLKFNLTSIPTNAIIEGATLLLTRVGGSNTSSTNISVHKITADWTEGSGSCSGNTGPASWNQRTSGTAWASSGGDFTATADAITAVAGNATYKWALKDLIQKWVNGSSPNYGMLLKMQTEGVANEKYFASSEYNTAGLRPQLEITYSIPGTTGITYAWSTGEQSQSIKPIVQNTTTYTVTVTDNTGCKTTTAKVVTVLPNPAAQAGPDVLTCYPESAFLIATANGGTLPYQFKWDNPLSLGPIKTVNPIATTTYYVTVTDSNGCTDTDDVLVTVAQKPTASATNDGPLSCAKTTALATAFPASGVSYLWNTAATTRSISIYTAGTYTVTVTDILSGCTSTAQTAVTGDLTKPELTILSDGPLTCTKNSLTMTATVTGGNPPYVFAWNNGLGSGQVKFVVPTQNTTYQVTVTDSKGCQAIASLFVSVFNNPIAATVNDGPITCFKNNVTVTASPSSGVSYLWNTGATSRSIQVNTAGTYTVTVTDSNSGCTSSSSSSVTGHPGKPVSLLVEDGPITCLKTLATLTASATGGNPPYQFSWSNNLGTGNQKVVSPAQSTTYSVTVTDVVGCTDTKSVLVTVTGKPIVSALNDGPLSCAKTSVTLTALPASGVTYLWNTGATARNVVVQTAGTYSVTVTDVSTLCTNVATTTVSGNTQSLQASISIEGWPDCLENTAILTASALGGNAPYQYQWDNNLGSGSVKEVSPTLPTTYSVTVTDLLSCSGTASVTLIPQGKAKVGDFVWEDKNYNGCQDTDEPGISGVKVSLYDAASNALIADTYTSASGYYEFEVCASTYYIVFGNYTGFYRTADRACGSSTLASGRISQSEMVSMTDEAKDSDADKLTGKTAVFTLQPGEFNRTIDAGFFRCIFTEFMVWYDINKNDIWNTNENGINGLEVRIWKKIQGQWYVWDTAKTGAKPNSPSGDGYCRFCAPDGEYYIEVLLPPLGLVKVRANVGNDENTDSDLTGANGPGTTDVFLIVPGTDIPVLKAGFYPMASAGNKVWMDENHNGTQDASEQAVSGVLVEAFDAQNGSKLGHALTNEQGEYTLDYLEKKDAYLRFYPPAGYIATTPHASEDHTDSDVDHSFGLNTTKSIAMVPGQYNQNIDMGIALGFLPVEWVEVSAKNKGTYHEIFWTTSNEINVSHYGVERRWGDESNFSLLEGMLDSKGNRSAHQTYVYKDNNVSREGVYTYRVKQVDLDGSFQYSQWVYVLRNAAHQISVFPNPALSETVISVSLENDSDTDIQLLDALGKKMMTVQAPAKVIAGTYHYTVPLQSLPEGLYTVRVNISGEYTYIKVVHVE